LGSCLRFSGRLLKFAPRARGKPYKSNHAALSATYATNNLGGRYQRNCPRASCLWRAKCWPSFFTRLCIARTCRSFVFPPRGVVRSPFVSRCIARICYHCKVPAKAAPLILFVTVLPNALTRKNFVSGHQRVTVFV